MTRRPHWAGELVVVVVLLVAYDRVAGLADVRADAAVQHGKDLLRLSPSGLERGADSWLAGVGWLHAPVAYYYDIAHVLGTMAVLVACYVWRAPVYRRARNALVAVNLVALAVFLLYPVAPPRLLPGEGFVDVVGESGTWGAWHSGGIVAAHANELAALPSLHLAWAVWVALTVTAMTGRPLLRALGVAHVVLTAVVVVVTGNHYVVDLVAGALVAGVAWAVVPLRWSRRPVPVAAVAD